MLSVWTDGKQGLGYRDGGLSSGDLSGIVSSSLGLALQDWTSLLKEKWMSLPCAPHHLNCAFPLSGVSQLLLMMEHWLSRLL